MYFLYLLYFSRFLLCPTGGVDFALTQAWFKGKGDLLLSINYTYSLGPKAACPREGNKILEVNLGNRYKKKMVWKEWIFFFFSGEREREMHRWIGWKIKEKINEWKKKKHRKRQTKRERERDEKDAQQTFEDRRDKGEVKRATPNSRIIFAGVTEGKTSQTVGAEGREGWKKHTPPQKFPPRSLYSTWFVRLESLECDAIFYSPCIYFLYSFNLYKIDRQIPC